MEAFEKIQRYGQERHDALLLATDRFQRCLDLVDEAQREGYSVEAIAKAMHTTRQTLWNRAQA